MSAEIRTTDVLIVGGGPVGLLLANLLGNRRIDTVVMERRHAPPAQSMAIGVTPPSLEIMRPLGLDRQLIAAGVPVRHAAVLEERDILGRLTFESLPSPYRFFLSVPQSDTIAVLRRRVREWQSVRFHQSTEFLDLEQDAGGVTLSARDLKNGGVIQYRARHVVGCDGHRSRVREAIQIAAPIHEYPQRWMMGDFTDESGLGDEARLFFTPDGSVESFPLPGRRRRWIAQLDRREPPADPAAELVRLIERLAGHRLNEPEPASISLFGAKRQLARSYRRDRVLLCGDAAHVMSSIGGQGMNTGFADAELLATALVQALDEPASADHWFDTWEQVRRAAFNVAANRAARGMWLGTLRGPLASRFRRRFIRHVLFSRWLRPRLAPYFAMLTIPNRNLANTPPALLALPQTV